MLNKVKFNNIPKEGLPNTVQFVICVEFRSALLYSGVCTNCPNMISWGERTQQNFGHLKKVCTDCGKKIIEKDRGTFIPEPICN